MARMNRSTADCARGLGILRRHGREHCPFSGPGGAETVAWTRSLILCFQSCRSVATSDSCIALYQRLGNGHSREFTKKFM